MNAIVTAALLGTAQQQNIETYTGTPVDTLTEKLPPGETERNLLLSAGAWALYRQAGRVTDSLPQPPEPAAAETLSLCSAELATLLESMLKGEHQELLPEALECVRRAALRIPYELLPTALAVQGAELRSAMFHLIGERGRWLSQFNPAWSRVSNYLPGAEDAQLANAETTWQEGTLGQRQAVLRLLRTTNPTKAREWLSAVWKQEKAEPPILEYVRPCLPVCLSTKLKPGYQTFSATPKTRQEKIGRKLWPRCLNPGAIHLARSISSNYAIISSRSTSRKTIHPTMIPGIRASQLPCVHYLKLALPSH